MQPRRRRSLPPRDRRSALPRHSTGRVRRRWPRAYDGGAPAGGDAESVNRRYRRGVDEDRRVERRRTQRARGALDNLRRNPLRNGLIGLAVAGTAAPIAVSQYQEAMRTAPSHEAALTGVGMVPGGEAGVANAWSGMASATTTAAQERDSVIQQKMDQYSEFGLTRELAETIYDNAEAANVDPDVAFGLVKTESSFKNSATSSVGAVGLTQLMPSTSRWLEPGTTRSDLRDPGTNLRIGMHYLRQLIDRYDGDTRLALLAYNRGPGTVDRVLNNGGNPDNGYADAVLGG